MENSRKRIIVIGDAIIDKYIYGISIRKNPENDHGRVIKYIDQKIKLGGALSVAYLISNFNQNVLVYTSVGEDFIDLTKQKLENLNINHIIIPAEYTTVKTRLVITDTLCQDRLDYDVYNEYNGSLNDLQIRDDDTIVIQDYGKGFCSLLLLDFLAQFPNKRIVDPYINCDWKKYKKPFLIKCNKNEAISNLRCKKPIKVMSKMLADKYKCHIIITDGKRGMCYYDFENDKEYYTYAFKVLIKDVCGAGDTVLATVATGIVNNFSMPFSCFLASFAASQQIQTIGINKVENLFIND